MRQEWQERQERQRQREDEEIELLLAEVTCLTETLTQQNQQQTAIASPLQGLVTYTHPAARQGALLRKFVQLHIELDGLNIRLARIEEKEAWSTSS